MFTKNAMKEDMFGGVTVDMGKEKRLSANEFAR